MKYKTAVFVLMLIVLYTFTSADKITFNSLRVLLSWQNSPNEGVVDEELLNRAVKNNYNYVVVPFIFRASDIIVGNGDCFQNLKDDVRSATVLLNAKGLKIIPLIPMSSRWALNWATLRGFENPNIGINAIYYNENLPDPFYKTNICNYKWNWNYGQDNSHYGGSNSWVEEPNGIDKTILDVFNAVKDGFEEANVPYSLEYIHIQHDEPNFLNWCLIGGPGSDCQTAYPYSGNFAITEFSQADRSFITDQISKGIDLTTIYTTILAKELFRRVEQVEQVFGTNLKVMFYAEALDNESWGGLDWFVYGGNGQQIRMTSTIDLPGLDEAQKRKFKEKSIPILWNYGSSFGLLGTNSYNTYKAVKRFADRGYNFMYAGAYKNSSNMYSDFSELSSYMSYYLSGKNPPLPPGSWKYKYTDEYRNKQYSPNYVPITEYLSIQNTSEMQVFEYSEEAKKYKDRCLGYYTGAWIDNYTHYDRNEFRWDMMEIMNAISGQKIMLPNYEKEAAFISILNTMLK